ncbi:trypsin-like peptidase domain-containing protein [Alienimonas californiensis]|uniref:trypsin-like peptidase domain-containing protein n=1 Tax=Alienimonas californiensis TaxID=2527989 RepID=UPI00119E5B42|nr:trypsin-like peptidase domain-containing protein [Alienimonas californiensis]
MPLFVAAAALSLASAGPPADAGPDPLAADQAATPEQPVVPNRLSHPERTAAFAGQGEGDVKLIWFTMTNCGPCQTIRPFIERMHADGLPIFKVDLNSRPDLAQRFGVNSAPTFLLEVNGEEVHRSSGVPGGDGYGVAQRLRTRLTSAMTANAAEIARAERSRQPERLPETPRRPAEPSDVPLQLTGGREQGAAESDRGLFDWLKFKKSQEESDGPKTIDDPFADADPSGFASADEPGAAPAAPSGGYERTAAVDAPPVSPERDPMKTVARIQVFDDAGLNYGSGTVIASRPGRAIVLTCGHIFRSHQPGGRIEVETFADGAPHAWPATLIGFDEKSDVGLLAVQCPTTVPASALAPPGVFPGDKVVSVGCDGGKEPTRQGHRVQRVPACVGPKNFSCTGQPQLGRSGGGCFDGAGRLMGVVWSRSEDPPEGIYTAIEPINALLDQHGLTALKPPPAGSTPGEAPAASPESGFDSPGAAAAAPQFAGAEAVDAEDGAATDNPAAEVWMDALFEEGAPTAAPARTAAVDPSAAAARPAATRESSAAVADVLGAAGGSEITCIIRPLGPEGGPTRIVVINQATQRTLALLQGDAAGGAVETSLYQPTAAQAASAPEAPVAPLRLGNGIVRTHGDAPASFCRPVVCRPRRIRR